jgi:hypothetical protein
MLARSPSSLDLHSAVLFSRASNCGVERRPAGSPARLERRSWLCRRDGLEPLSRLFGPRYVERPRAAVIEDRVPEEHVIERSYHWPVAAMLREVKRRPNIAPRDYGEASVFGCGLSVTLRGASRRGAQSFPVGYCGCGRMAIPCVRHRCSFKVVRQGDLHSALNRCCAKTTASKVPRVISLTFWPAVCSANLLKLQERFTLVFAVAAGIASCVGKTFVPDELALPGSFPAKLMGL